MDGKVLVHLCSSYRPFLNASFHLHSKTKMSEAITSAESLFIVPSVHCLTIQNLDQVSPGGPFMERQPMVSTSAKHS